MAGELFSVTDDQRKRLLKYEEDHFGDIKSRDIKPAKMSRSVAAFANADGGELWIGIGDDTKTHIRTWLGFARIEDANAHLDILSNLFPFGGYTFEFLEHRSSAGYLLHIELQKARSIVRSTEGMPYVRKGAQNLPVDTDEKLRQLERNKGITSFESETIIAAPEVITNSATTIEFLLDQIPTAEPDDWLRKQNVIVDDKPTVAGVVLYADEPQALLPKRCGIKIYRYATTLQEGTRETLSFQPLSIEGNAYGVIRDAVTKTQEIIESISTLGEKGFEDVRYPHETLHEIITNAVLHRDYGVPDDIHVRIFDNRVEIESPGVLPGHITEKNILKERFARNPSVVRLINKFRDPPNKDVGEGLNVAFAAMKIMKLRPPEISQGEHSVVVYIRHTRLASAEETVVNYLNAGNQVITNSIGRSLTGITSDNTMKDVFSRLKDRKVLERVPDKRGRSAAWQFTEAARREYDEVMLLAAAEAEAR